MMLARAQKREGAASRQTRTAPNNQPSMEQGKVIQFPEPDQEESQCQWGSPHEFDDFSEMAEENSRWLSRFHQIEAPFKHSFTTRFNVAPLFYYQARQPRDERGHLPVLKRDFQVDNGFISTAEILPAKVEITKGKGKKKGKWQEHYPGQKEEILLEVLKKMATTGRATILDNNLAVAFSIREVRAELKRIGRTASHAEILQSLQILRRSSFILRTEIGTTFEETYILSLGVKGEGKNQKVVVRFNTPTTAAIQEGDFRILDYETTIRISALGRKLIERIVHTHKQLDLKGYDFEMIDFLKGAGFEGRDHLQKAKQRLVAALDQVTLKARIKENDLQAAALMGQKESLNRAMLLSIGVKAGKEIKEQIKEQIKELDQQLVEHIDELKKLNRRRKKEGFQEAQEKEAKQKKVAGLEGKKKGFEEALGLIPNGKVGEEIRKQIKEQITKTEKSMVNLDKGKPRVKFTHYSITPIYQDGGRKKVIDYAVLVFPTGPFVSEIKKANWEQKQFRELNR